MPKLQLSFHTTFSLRKEDLLKILRVASEEKGLDDSIENLMTKTGLGNKKVAPMKSWALRAGLIYDNSLSPEGEIVWRNDPRLESKVTDWLIHFFLSFGGYGLQLPPDDPAEWGGWPYFIFSFAPKARLFTLDDLIDSSRFVFPQERPDRLRDNFRILLRAYTEKNALAGCNFLHQTEDKEYKAGESQFPNPYLFGYFIARLWERDFQSSTSVLTDDILQHKMGIVPLLGITVSQVQELLDALEVRLLIEQRRTVPPFQIVRRWDNPLELLEKAYSNRF